ncbi:hypothetical protein G4Y79_01290 [Phototrophicus methaneseepsis]|uniref:Uncharacterized protein n=1 Tax=Phototrophicus methaneseepsis TaxID=2710758 RepID=A0A7S8IFK1_9CHLR|nr:hypothetical protein [Phototrophicus methaneseepsis]QPC83038.1 hypothetical protein G4Y79_01290 [Phototrophicus methaneseepsis]
MIEKLQYKDVKALQVLSLEELQALWELVPTERQKAYRTAYDREVRNAGAIGSDDLEQRVAAELLLRYVESALVPVGSRWARTPERVQEAARENDLPELTDKTSQTASSKPSPKVILGMGLVGVIFLLLMLMRLLGGGDSENLPEMTLEATYTPTPEVSPTPTPLALEAQDDVITDGDSDRAVAYPVNLQVILPDGSAPRVWVVQRREVRAAQWNFDPNPDIASFVNGMSVRPVIGIPWSEDNASLFENIEDGTVFNLTMNTGAILSYEFATRDEVLRSDTRIFRQVGPGLVLLLIGETDIDGLPTGTRTLVSASYSAEQELSRGGELLGLTAIVQEGEIGSTLEFNDGVSVALQNMQSLSDLSDVPAGQQALLFDLDVIADTESIATNLWQIELVDAGGQVYLPNTTLLQYASYGTLPDEIPAFARIPSSLAFLVPQDFPGGRLLISDDSGQRIAFRFTLEQPELSVEYDGLDVRLVSVTTIEGQITTRLRIYNGQTTAIYFTQDDIWLSLGYAPDPPGPRNPAEGLQPFTLLPEQAVDLTLVWYWGGEPFGALQVGTYRFAIQIHRSN